MRQLWLAAVVACSAAVGCSLWRQPAPMSAPTAAAPKSPPTLVIQPSPTPYESPQRPAPIVQASAHEVEQAPPAPEAKPDPLVQAAEAKPDPLVQAAEAKPDPLVQAAEALDRGDKPAAADALEAYVRQHPNEVMFRLQLVELLVQTGADARARAHLEQFVVRAQTGPEAVRKYLVHVHTRLMEIAQRNGDSFGEQFHRGVGLLLLVQEQDKDPDRDAAFCEEMLCKALRAFNSARDLNPDDPRVRVYLAEVYARMGNPRGAKVERAAARSSFLPAELTPDEKARVLLP